MVKISPDETLLKYGDWIPRDTYIDLVSKDRHVGPRQAWNIINNESRAKKHVYQDRTTIYGLPEFGPPTPKIELFQANSKPQIRTDVNIGPLFNAIDYYRNLAAFFHCKAAKIVADNLVRTARDCNVIPREKKE